jgi:hypothetical protein
MLVAAWLPAGPLYAWSSKEHIQLTRIAAERLLADPSTPTAMKSWLSRQVAVLDMEGEKQFLLHTHIGPSPTDFAGILRYATRPDDHALQDSRDSKLPAFNAPEKQMHFIDLELFLPGNVKKEYRADLSSKPRIDDFPNNAADPRYVQAGYLPLRVEYCYKKLVESLRAGKLDHSSDKLEDEENSAPRWAGYLAHYLEDNTQPQHATMDYKSASYFSNKRKAPNVHAEVEYRMIDDDKNEHAALRGEFWPLLATTIESLSDPIQTDDLFRATLEVSSASYDALPMIGEAAVAAHKPSPGAKADEIDTEVFFRHEGMLRGQKMSVMQMKAHQLAWAIKRVQREWLRAWNEAMLPAPATNGASTAPATAPVSSVR